SRHEIWSVPSNRGEMEKCKRDRKLLWPLNSIAADGSPDVACRGMIEEIRSYVLSQHLFWILFLSFDHWPIKLVGRIPRSPKSTQYFDPAQVSQLRGTQFC